MRSKSARAPFVMMAGVAVALSAGALSNQADAATGASIQGVVTDSDGKPVRGAIVKAAAGDKAVARYTDAAGRYRITGLKPGEEEVTVDAFGFAAASQIVRSAKDAAVDFKLTAQMDITRMHSAELRFLFPNTKEDLRVYARCSNCHGLELPARRTGMPAAAWVGFLPYMTVHRWGSNQGFSPAWAATFGPALAEIFGPEGILGPKATPDFSKIHYTPVSDTALKATITEYTLPSPGAMPHSVRVDDKSGIVWLADYDALSNDVVRFDPRTETFKRFPLPLAKASAHTGTVLEDGRFIIAFDRGVFEKMPTKLATVSAAGHVDSYDFPDRPGGARVIEVDPVHKDFVWIVAGPETWYLNVKTRRLRVYQNPLPPAYPPNSNGALMAEKGFEKPTADGYDIAVDAHGIPWVTQIDAATIFRIDPATGQTRSYNSPDMRSARGIKVDTHGIIWFADFHGSKLGRLDPNTGKIELYQPPTRYASPYGITLDRRRGFVWYADTTANHATRFDPRSGEFVEYALPTHNTSARFLGIDPQGRAWYGGFFTGKLGVVDPGDGAGTGLVSTR